MPIKALDREVAIDEFSRGNYRYRYTEPNPYTDSSGMLSKRPNSLDENQNEIRENAELFVDRLYKPKRKSMPRSSGLYDRGTTAEVIEQNRTNKQTEFRDPRIPKGYGL